MAKVRYRSIDVLRGLALFFILLYNVNSFILPMNLEAFAYMFSSGLQNIAAWVILILVNGKGHVLYSFLFGLCGYLYFDSYGKYKYLISRNYSRRLLGIILFGLLHVIFIWSGDILLLYGLLGIWLLYFNYKNDSFVYTWMVILFVFSVLSNFLIGLNLVSMDSNLIAVGVKYFSVVEVFQVGSFVDVLMYRLDGGYIGVLFGYLVFASSVLGFFLMGLIVGRFGLIMNFNYYMKFCKVWFWDVFYLSLGLCILLNGFYLAVGNNLVFANWKTALLFLPVFSYLSSIVNLVFFLFVVLLVLKCNCFERIVGYIANSGKMSLTCYVMQSLIMVFVFYGYGLGLYYCLNVVEGVILVVCVYIFQVVFSSIWLKYFRYGILEWLLRMITVWQYLKLRVKGV